MSSIITKDGKRINLNGSLSMINGNWYVDGKPVNIKELASNVTEDEKSIHIDISIEGVIEHLDVENCKTLTINGDCKRAKTNCGGIIVNGNVDGDVHTNMGAIECGNVSGDVRTYMGSIIYRKD